MYETTLAAFHKVQSTFDPHFINSVVLTILGITEDADAYVLKQISESTPAGASRVARSADDIPNIVTDLIRARTAAH
ncbi:hypothetical protein DE4585_00443 [Mycobacteroides salmoniphilum]|uniref:Uncharacterized protein n=1 Tax=Mycobacteroides salmoniphilum TaxID=404941 RepID=A0A4R8S7K4_9MYCO|nr:hypothetical protein DE4586_00463 [Mycobacteroides salmoniphilum]TDZ87449.1 hypothetical protein DE4585_00443 [Mycobacteroides salmoniphilum]TDZ88026.1 hypothetical protein DE4587_00379 [Mycobacteroides salmoniphilum]